MTTEQQAVALAEKHGIPLMYGLVEISHCLTAMLTDHRQQVIEELASKAKVMPGLYPYANIMDGGVCRANEVREAIAAMQAKLEQAEKDAARYRFMRDADRSDENCPYEQMLMYAMESLDDAIDAAMEKKP